MSCEIKVSNNNSATVTRFPELWNEIQEKVSNFDQQVSIYTQAVSDGFLDLNIKNPSFNQVMSYLDYNKEGNIDGKFTKKERNFIRDFSINRENIKDLILNAFTTEEGVFGYDESILEQYFSISEVTDIISSRPKELENIYYKLRNGEEIQEIVRPYSIVKRNPDQTVENPDYTIEFLEQFFTGLDNVNDIEATASDLDYEISDAEVNYILDNLSDKKLIPEFSKDGQRKLYNKTSDILKQTLQVGTDVSDVLIALNTLQAVTAITWIEDGPLVEEVILELEDAAQEVGLDLSELSDIYLEIVESKSPEEALEGVEQFANFFSMLEEFLIDVQTLEITEEKVDLFGEAMDAFFGDSSFTKDVVREKNDSKEFSISGKISEFEAFTEFNAIKVGRGVYKKVPSLDINQVKEEIYKRLKPGNPITELNKVDYNKKNIDKEIDSYLESKAREIGFKDANYETLKVIQGLKYIYGVENIFDDVSYPKETVNINDLEVDIHKELLNKPELMDYLGFSSEGIELLSKGEYSRSYLQDNLKNFNKLQSYAAITGIESLRSLLPVEGDQSIREYYVNNPHKVEQLKGDYKTPTPTTVLTQNDNAEFINVENEIYEKVGPLNYELVSPYSNEIQSNLNKPIKKIDNPYDYFTESREKLNIKKGDIDSIMC